MLIAILIISIITLLGIGFMWQDVYEDIKNLQNIMLEKIEEQRLDFKELLEKNKNNDCRDFKQKQLNVDNKGIPI